MSLPRRPVLPWQRASPPQSTPPADSNLGKERAEIPAIAK
jgi:hypothetical protein